MGNKRLTLCLYALFPIFLTACGGGGGDSDTPTTPAPTTNQSPQVSISGEQNLQEGQISSLSATATDSDGTIANYSWSQTQGPTSIFTFNAAVLNFTAPDVESDTTITFQVMVTDNDGASASANYTINIQNDTNAAPIISSEPIADITELSEASIQVSAVDSDGSIVSIEWQQLRGPVINFTQTGQIINFTAPEVPSTSEVEFLVTATDDRGASSELPVTFMIVNVNKAPILNDTNFVSEFNQSTEFTLNIQDPDNDELTVSFASDLDGATITVVDEASFTYQYTSAINRISQAPISVSVSDGIATTQATINVAIIDSTAATIINVNPQNNSQAVSVNASLSIDFSDVMKTSSLSVNETAEGCVGSLQLSDDDFSSCLAITSLNLSGPESDTNTYFNGVTFSPALQQNRTYKLRVTEDLVNFDDTAINAQEITEFSTGSGDLVITEVVAIRFGTDAPWFEVYNGTGSDINLADYKVRTKSRNSSDGSITSSTIFNLPNQLIEVGEYAIIHSRFGDELFYDAAEQNKYIAFIGEAGSTIRPYWFVNGFIELLSGDETTTIDFVRFGNDTTEPTSPAHWSTGAAPSINNITGSSIKRDKDSTDTDTPSDWIYSLFTTPAGANDLTCEDDLDQDGIPDCAELPGSSFAGLPLYDWGARVNQKDLFVEVDYMDSSDAGIIPQRIALEKVISSFAAENIVVHFDVGDLYHQATGMSVENYDLGGGEQVIFRPYTPYNFNAGVEGLFHYKMANFDMRRKPIFHYMLMASSLNEDGSVGPAGLAEVNGNDLMITFGNWGLSLDNEASRNLTYNYQASTIMHELGHNLGLEHGGNNSINYKPNHLSIMNYLYQLRGLPTIGNNEGDRYYSSRYRTNPNCGVETSELVNGPLGSPESFVMSFSHGLGAPLDETSIEEANGLGYPGSVAVDYNCNLNLTETLSQDTNDDASTSVLNDVDEWSLIDLRFYSYFSGNRFGLDFTELNTVNNANTSIRQRIIKEEAPPLFILDEIQAVRKAAAEQ